MQNNHQYQNLHVLQYPLSLEIHESLNHYYLVYEQVKKGLQQVLQQEKIDKLKESLGSNMNIYWIMNELLHFSENSKQLKQKLFELYELVVIGEIHKYDQEELAPDQFKQLKQQLGAVKDKLEHSQITHIDDLISLKENTLRQVKLHNVPLLSKLKLEIQEEERQNVKICRLMGRKSSVGQHLPHTLQLISQIMSYSQNEQEYNKRYRQCLACLNCSNSSDNPLLTCQSCTNKVHAGCYPFILSSTFVCQICLDRVRFERSQCIICKQKGGLMIRTNVQSDHEVFKQIGKKSRKYKRKISQQATSYTLYIHLLCARWYNIESFDKILQIVTNVIPRLLTKNALSCVYCKKNSPSPIKCEGYACNKAYHPECARRAGAYLFRKNYYGIKCIQHRDKDSYQKIQSSFKERIRHMELFNNHIQSVLEGKPLQLQITKSPILNTIETEELYCVCKQPYNQQRPMIQCDLCNEWYHYPCIQLQQKEYLQFICKKCTRKA